MKQWLACKVRCDFGVDVANLFCGKCGHLPRREIC